MVSRLYADIALLGQNYAQVKSNQNIALKQGLALSLKVSPCYGLIRIQLCKLNDSYSYYYDIVTPITNTEC